MENDKYFFGKYLMELTRSGIKKRIYTDLYILGSKMMNESMLFSDFGIFESFEMYLGIMKSYGFDTSIYPVSEYLPEDIREKERLKTKFSI